MVNKYSVVIKYFVLLTISISIICSCKKNTPTPQNTIYAAGNGVIKFNGASDTLDDVQIFDSAELVTGYINEITMNSSLYNTGVETPQVIIDYMPVATSGTFSFTSQTTSTPYQQDKVWGLFTIYDGAGNNKASYNIKSGTLTKTGANSFSFNCIVYNTSNASNTYTLLGAGTY